MGLRETILAAQDLRLAGVDVPEWGCHVHFKSLSGKDRDELSKALEGKAGYLWEAELLVRTLCDSSGELLFKPNEVELLRAKSPDAMDRVTEAVLDHNGIGKKAQDKLKGNSSAPPAASST